jgi:hypothetical protein
MQLEIAFEVTPLPPALGGGVCDVLVAGVKSGPFESEEGNFTSILQKGVLQQIV